VEQKGKLFFLRLSGGGGGSTEKERGNAAMMRIKHLIENAMKFVFLMNIF